MNLYLISQSINNEWETYDSAVVAANSPEDARKIHPNKSITSKDKWMKRCVITGSEHGSDSWVSSSDIEEIKVELLGETTREQGIILASFNGC